MSHLQMQFLGAFHVSLDEQHLTTFESSKVRALLAFLATEAHRPHPRESLAARLTLCVETRIYLFTHLLKVAL